MDQTNEFKDEPKVNTNPIDFNTCFFYQAPYINISPYAINSEFLWNYPNNIRLNDAFSHFYPVNQFNDVNQSQISNSGVLNNKQNKNKVTKHVSCNDNKYSSNENKEQEKSVNLPHYQGQNTYAKLRTNVKVVEQPFEILARDKKKDIAVAKKNESPVKPIDNDTDFPPISNTFTQVTDKKLCVKRNTLDFKLALQKPKKVVEDAATNATVIVEAGDQIKKKRKRKRKKKANICEKKEVKEVKTFEFVDEEFPTLDEVQKELFILAEKSHDKEKEGGITDYPIHEKEAKKSKRRQLMFILPKDVEGQVRIVEAKSIKKSKIKRRVNQDRMKRPIGLLNPMDLSGPTVKRGKERLIPKVKKPSKLKKTILLCRNLKRGLRATIGDTPAVNGTEDVTIYKPTTAVVEVITKPLLNSSSKMHSKNFREYCNHMVGNKINSMISTLLKTLITFQDKLYNRDPMKAKIKRRLCFGLREVTKFVNMKKLRLIIIAPDLEKVDIQGGLDDIVDNIIQVSKASSIPCIFGLNRSSLAYLCFKKFKVGSIGIFNFDGAENQVKELLKAVDEARYQYNQLKQIMESITDDVAAMSECANYQLKSNTEDNDDPNENCSGVNVGHSRTPSNALSEPISEIIEVNKSTFNSIFEDQNYHHAEAENVGIELNEDVEDNLIDEYVEDCLDCVSKLNLND